MEIKVDKCCSQHGRCVFFCNTLFQCNHPLQLVGKAKCAGAYPEYDNDECPLVYSTIVISRDRPSQKIEETMNPNMAQAMAQDQTQEKVVDEKMQKHRSRPPKKRGPGRPPKAKSTPKKRGRPPKAKAQMTPKKRGRPTKKKG